MLLGSYCRCAGKRNIPPYPTRVYNDPVLGTRSPSPTLLSCLRLLRGIFLGVTRMCIVVVAAFTSLFLHCPHTRISGRKFTVCSTRYSFFCILFTPAYKNHIIVSRINIFTIIYSVLIKIIVNYSANIRFIQWETVPPACPISVPWAIQ